MKTLLASLLICAAAYSALAQEKQAPDVIRVNTDLVQTNVMVFDKQGHFVDGLTPEQFEFRVAGKPEPIAFFQAVIGGTVKNAITAAGTSVGTAGNSVPEQRGRRIIFFIDDLHLSSISVTRTKQAIIQFLETEMAPDDEVEIASATGQIGFLQQFTDNRNVLRAALARLNYRPYVVVDAENISMSEYSAIKVDEGDRDAIDYYTVQLLQASTYGSPQGGVGPPAGGAVASSAGATQNRTSGLTKEGAERMVKQRAQVLLRQAESVTSGTLLTLQRVVRATEELPGRKLVFFISDGFFLGHKDNAFMSKLRQITDAALRSGVVIYSMDARGLTNTLTDASSNKMDPSGKLSRSNIGELSASQDPLNTLAEDTGGRALLNSDAMKGAITRALNETSNYYVIAWKPSAEEQKSPDFKQIEVAIVGRPDLKVKLPRGYLPVSQTNSVSTDASSKTVDKPEAKTPENDLRAALTSSAPRRNIPTIVAASYLDTPNNGPLVTTSVQANIASLDYGTDGKQPAALDVAGVVLNDQGKPAGSFKTRLNVSPVSNPNDLSQAAVDYNYKTPLKPGIYQVRTAVRDGKNGKVGSATQWIEVPDLSGKTLQLSSLLVGGQVIDVAKKADGAATLPQVQISVDRSFPRSSELGFWIFIYNAQAGGTAGPDLTAQLEVTRNGRSVVAVGPRKLTTQGMSDLARIPYGGKFPLASLTPGIYDLSVTITDKLAHTSARQNVNFRVR